MNIVFDKGKNDLHKAFVNSYPENIYLFKVNNRNTRKTYKTCPKLAVKTTERHQ